MSSESLKGLAPHHKVVEQLLVEHNMELFEREVLARRSKKTTAQLIHDVIFEDAEVLGSEGLSIKSVYGRIQYLVRSLQKVYQSESACSFPSLAYASFKYGSHKNILLVKCLITKMSHEDITAEKMSLIRYTLRLLEKIDPMIRSLNCFVDIGLDQRASLQEHQFACAKLTQFIRQGAPLIISIPMQPAPLCAVMPERKGPIHPFWRINHIYHGALSIGQESCWGNLQTIAPLEDFSVGLCKTQDQGLVWLCDSMISLESGMVLVPQVSCFDQRMFDFYDDLVAGRTIHGLGTVSSMRVSELLCQTKTMSVQMAPFYFEGGNLMPAIDKRGQKVYLCGANNVLFSLLNASETFRGMQKELLVEMEKMSPKEQKRAEFILSRIEKSTFLSSRLSLSQQELLSKYLVIGIPRVLELMQDNLGAKVVLIGDVFEELCEFHVDVFLMPAPDGKIFIQDYDLCIQALREVLSSGALTLEERKRAKKYLGQAYLRRDRQKAQLDRITKDLVIQGFEVIPFPGIYSSRRGRMDVNFINAVVGENESGIFCLTNGSIHSLDLRLREYSLTILHSHQIKNVYFTGREERGPISSKGGLEYRCAKKGLVQGGGIHCRVQTVRGDLKKDGGLSLVLNTDFEERFNRKNLYRQPPVSRSLRSFLSSMERADFEKNGPQLSLSGLSFPRRLPSGLERVNHFERLLEIASSTSGDSPSSGFFTYSGGSSEEKNH